MAGLVCWKIHFGTIEVLGREFKRCLYSKSRYVIPRANLGKGHGRKERPVDTSREDAMVLYKQRLKVPKSAMKEREQMHKRFAGRISRSIEYRDINSAIATITEMKSYNVVPNVKIYNRVISGLSRAGDAELALHYFDEMRDKGQQPTSRTFCSLFHAISKGGRSHLLSKRIREILDIFRNSDSCRDVKDSLYVYNAAMKAFIFCGEPAAAFEMYDDMQSLEITGDGFTTATLLLACQQDKENGMKNAVTVLNEIKRNGSINFSEVDTWNNFLLVCRDCKDREYHEVFLKLVDPTFKYMQGMSDVSMYLKIMESIGCNFDLRTHQLLLYFAKSLVDIKNIYESLTDCGHVMDRHFLITLVTKYMYLTEPMASANAINDFIQQHEIEDSDPILEGVYNSFQSNTKRYQLSKALESLGYEITAMTVDQILHGIYIGKKQPLIKMVIQIICTYSGQPQPWAEHANCVGANLMLYVVCDKWCLKRCMNLQHLTEVWNVKSCERGATPCICEIMMEVNGEEFKGDAETRNIVPTRKTIDLVEKYADELVKRRKVDQHYLFLNKWLEKHCREEKSAFNINKDKYKHL